MTDCSFPHDADGAGYCEACGLAIGPSPPPCPNCGEPHGGGRFCEACGHPHDAQLRAPTRWVAVVTADREQFDTCDAAACGFAFPAVAERRVELTGRTIRIGRQSRLHPEAPEIDLSDPPADPGVSRDHAQLLRQDDGSWQLVDVGSVNGTYLDDGRDPLPRNRLVPLTPGSRIRIGLWTSITVDVVP